MSFKSCYNAGFVKKLLLDYSNGEPAHQICKAFALSESNFYFIISKFPKLYVAAKKKRKKMILKKKKLLMKNKFNGPKVKVPKKIRSSSAEKIKQLEERLKRERDKNKELEELLRIAKDELGKY